MTALAGKVALVTGASRGIGRASACALARLGASVYAAAEGTPDELASVVAQCTALAPRARAAWGVFDLARAEHAPAMVEAALAELGRVDILVNNAGIRIRRPFGAYTADEFDTLVAINLRAPFLASQAVIPAMKRQGGGRIIHVASQMGIVTSPTSALYGLSKAALIYLTKAMAVDLAHDGISVNCVSPGPIETEFNRARLDAQPGLREQRAARVPLQRWGTPDEVAETIAFLASTGATYIHGSNLVIDGGYVVQ